MVKKLLENLEEREIIIAHINTLERRIKEEGEKKAVKEAINNKDLDSLHLILKGFQWDYLQTDHNNSNMKEAILNYLKRDFIYCIKFNSIKRMQDVLKCYSYFNTESDSYFRDTLLSEIKKEMDKIRNHPINIKISLIEKLKSYDYEDILNIHAYLEGKKKKEIKDFLNSINSIKEIRNMDKWINECIQIEDPCIIEKYKEVEQEYLDKCIIHLKRGDKHVAEEDLVYLVNKIKKRSRSLGIEVDDKIRKSVEESGIIDSVVIDW